MRLPKYIEPRKLAQKNGLFDGEVLAEDIPRVMSALVSCEQMKVKLEFDIDIERRRTMTGTIDGLVHMQCQRCLEPVEVKLHVDVRLAMVWDEEKAKQLPATVEPWIVGEDPEDLHAIIEEEILLSMPVVAYHTEHCVDATTLSVGTLDDEPESRPNPFQVLETLKNTSKKPN